MARATQSNTVSASDLLAYLNSNASVPASGESLGFTNWVADISAGAVDRVGKLAGALREGGGNFVDHYKLERAVQHARGQARLKAAAEEAARRINATLAG